jgi:hypothetical protein
VTVPVVTTAPFKVIPPFSALPIAKVPISVPLPIAPTDVVPAPASIVTFSLLWPSIETIVTFPTPAPVSTFTTANDNITFATGNIELADGSNLTIDTGAGVGNVTIVSIDGHSSENVTIDAGAGTTSVGAIGSGTEIGTLAIGSAENGGITLKGAVVTTGTVTLDGPVTLDTGAISVTTTNDDITFNHTQTPITLRFSRF